MSFPMIFCRPLVSHGDLWRGVQRIGTTYLAFEGFETGTLMRVILCVDFMEAMRIDRFRLTLLS